MEGFCLSSFWDSNLFWNNSWPQVTECFQHTVLVWVPCGFLWLLTPFYTWQLTKRRTAHLPASALFKVRLGSCCILTAICAVEVILRLKEDLPEKVASITESLIFLFSVIFSLVLTVLERRKGCTTSRVQFFFWLLVSACNIVIVYSLVLQKVYIHNSFGLTLVIMRFTFVFMLLCLHCFAAKVTTKPFHGKKQSPEIRASFLSSLTFSWMSRLMVKGYKTALTEDIVYDLHPLQKCSSVVPRFLRNWNKESIISRKRKSEERHHQRGYINSSFIGQNCDVDQEMPLLSSLELDQDGEEEKEDEKRDIPFFRVLLKTFGLEALFIQVLQRFYDTLVILHPLMLGWLLDLIEDKKSLLWKSYALSVMLFFSIILKSVIDKQIWHLSGRFGLRVRSTIMSAVFRKALTMDAESKQLSTTGEMVNLMSVDADHLEFTSTFLFFIGSGVIQTAVSLAFLYNILGSSMFAGLALVLILVPVNIYILNQLRKIEVKMMELKDSRLKILSEVLNGIKILKMYAWEPFFSDKIASIREEELKIRWRSAFWDTFLHFSWTVAPYIISLAMFVTYIYLNEDHYLRPQTAFVTLAFLNVLRTAVNLAPGILSDIIKASVSIRRLHQFLNHTDLPVINIEGPMVNTEPIRQKLSLILRIHEGFLNVPLDGHGSTYDEWFSTVFFVSASKILEHLFNVHRRDQDDEVLSVSNGTFTWKTDIPPTLTNIKVSLVKGSLTAVVGPVGAGKSSLLSAILGEMSKVEGRVCVKGSMAYVPQQAWIQNDSVRGNILFGKHMDKEWYDKCVSASALGPDLDIFPGADLTEIGEKGINLSGGQKQRVSLARAVYSKADTYLFDDPLSAVDIHVGMHIFDQVISHKGLLAGKTRVLVTHGIQWLPLVDQILVMRDGCIVEAGSYAELVSRESHLANFLKTCLDGEHRKVPEKVNDVYVKDDGDMVIPWKLAAKDIIRSADNNTGDQNNFINEHSGALPIYQSTTDQVHLHKLCFEETISTNKAELFRTEEELGNNILNNRHKLVEEEQVDNKQVSWDVLKVFVQSIGNAYFVAIVGVFALYHVSSAVTNVCLSKWTDNQELNNFTLLPANSNKRMELNSYYLSLYGGFGVLQALLMISFKALQSFRMISASRALHNSMLSRVLHAPMSFFDTTPTGRIMNRFSEDINVIDAELPFSFSGGIESTCLVVSSLILITYSTPWFLGALVPLTALYLMLQRFYIATSRQLKRLGSKAQSPIYSYFGEALHGASVIRAFHVQNQFIAESEKRIDENTRFRFYNYCSNRWMGFRLDVLGGLVVLTTAVAAASLRDTMSTGLVGLALTYALEMTGILDFLIMSVSELEAQVVSVERIKQYMDLVIEAPWRCMSSRPHKSWPSYGEVKVDDIDLQYREGLDLVLKEVTFHVAPGEKVGIVGRTGAGKSSLTLALFRLMELTKGTICIDDLEISSLGLHDLRSKIAILPQDSFVFAGTLRANLDPFSQFSDAELWKSLDHAHLKVFVDQLPDRLEYKCSEGGENLSMGQRQLMCLARTLLHKTKVLVLDEATAAVDMETDDLIQATLRSQFKDYSVLTIAHRLHTVMDYDKIMVLDKGQLIAFDSPEKLLQDPTNLFYSMAQSAGLVIS